MSKVLSNLSLAKTVPEFVRKMYPRFVEFIGEYFKFLDQDGAVMQEISHFLDNHDTSNENAVYWDRILADLAFNLDVDMFKVDKKLLVLFIKDYYLSRGSAKSVEFLFRLLFNDRAKVKYPRDYLMTLSNTEYTTQKMMFLEMMNINMNTLSQLQESARNFNLIGTGLSSGATMIVDNVDLYDEFIRLLISTTQEFTPHEIIRLVGDGVDVKSRMVPVKKFRAERSYGGPEFKKNLVVMGHRLEFRGFTKGYLDGHEIKNPGEGYVVGDYATDMDGLGIYIEVTKVDSNGGITEFNIINRGEPTSYAPTLYFHSKTGKNGVIEGILDNDGGHPKNVICHDPVFHEIYTYDYYFTDFTDQAIFETPPQWENDHHVLGHNAVVIDSNYWHQYAYMIESSTPRSEYDHIIKSQVHTPGYGAFSLMNKLLEAKMINNDTQNRQLVGMLFSSLIASTSTDQHEEWERGKSYTIGSIVMSGDALYIATSNGEAGPIKPKHREGRATDGAIQWQFMYAVDPNLRGLSRFYLALGNDEDGLFYAKRITHNDIRLGVKCQEYNSGTVERGILYRNSENEIYYCVRGGNSTVPPKPAGKSTLTTDGLVWRYLGKLDLTDEEFITDEYIPIKATSSFNPSPEVIDLRMIANVGNFATDEYPELNDGTAKISIVANTNGTIDNFYLASPGNHKAGDRIIVVNYDIYTGMMGRGAVAKAVIQDGAIAEIKVEAPGENYATWMTNVFIDGDGQGASATINVSAYGSVESITINDGGSGYTWADVYIIGKDTAAIFECIGSDVQLDSILHSTRADALIVSTKLNTVIPYLNDDDRYNTIALITSATTGSHLHIGSKGSNQISENAVKIWEAKIPDAQRSAGQNEQIKIALTME